MKKIILLVLIFNFQLLLSEKFLEIKVYNIQNNRNFLEIWNFIKPNKLIKETYILQNSLKSLDIRVNSKELELKNKEIEDLEKLKQIMDEVYIKKMIIPEIICDECKVIPRSLKIITTSNNIKQIKKVVFNNVEKYDVQIIYEIKYKGRVIYLINEEEAYEDPLLREYVNLLNEFNIFTSICIFDEENSVRCNFKK